MQAGGGQLYLFMIIFLQFIHMLESIIIVSSPYKKFNIISLVFLYLFTNRAKKRYALEAQRFQFILRITVL